MQQHLPDRPREAIFFDTWTQVDFGQVYDVKWKPGDAFRVYLAKGFWGDAGVKVVAVVDGSVAATTGIRAGDLISSAAGFETAAASACPSRWSATTST